MTTDDLTNIAVWLLVFVIVPFWFFARRARSIEYVRQNIDIVANNINYVAKLKERLSDPDGTLYKVGQMAAEVSLIRREMHDADKDTIQWNKLRRRLRRVGREVEFLLNDIKSP